MITSTWNSFTLVDSNGMIRFKKKLQLLKKVIRKWVAEYKSIHSNSIRDVKNKLSDIDKLLDKGGVTDDVLLSHMEAMKQLQELNSSDKCDFVQKAKGIMSEGEWVADPICVKDEFRNHFVDRFNDPGTRHGRINFSFPNRLTIEQVSDLEASVSDEEIRKVVWGCGENKSPAMLGEIHALSKPATSNSVPTPQESKVIKNDKVITPGMFRINPFKTSREEKHVPNNSTPFYFTTVVFNLTSRSIYRVPTQMSSFGFVLNLLRPDGVGVSSLGEWPIPSEPLKPSNTLTRERPILEE
uniref:RNA-directed DNA polymerase, eukaryota, reverse transcriptase zinc-binding domain protein n=1 Tax=Tanacetum cinerariifolium TaxID=118510 RepID=A0A6L2KJQ5_TANCI|nr:RNA-directed DNA polymerase, eukaryota, reverse transcriptase zinc-binding domain protein [Tanacetum cinerariifolium]